MPCGGSRPPRSAVILIGYGLPSEPYPGSCSGITGSGHIIDSWLEHPDGSRWVTDFYFETVGLNEGLGKRMGPHSPLVAVAEGADGYHSPRSPEWGAPPRSAAGILWRSPAVIHPHQGSVEPAAGIGPASPAVQPQRSLTMVTM